ncbi:alkyl/aryl-sulfatase [Hahella ganghwensis]|uniref:alkyl/aryl-sulfatase n=1 Tax=Hahella ganghwensis TaxID=286420 RepID=UPI001B7FB035|nr:alkyl sulfatase dimerization domain-containing protein [Hahella ganghwensis]
MSACSGPLSESSSEASEYTKAQHAKVLEALPFEDKQDFNDSNKGLIARAHANVIKDGQSVWNTQAFNFITGDAPDTVNPSLWRQATLNHQPGLYEVTDGVYQVRGFDLANMTLIEGDKGWIVVDPLTTVESARLALSLANEHLGEKPVSAIIFTHAHIDHFGGALGIVTPEQVAEHNIPIIAPEGFMGEATSENVIVGLAMGRRAGYMYGSALEKSDKGYIGSGLGKGPVMGTFSILEPSITVSETGQRLVVDGVEMVFQYTPETESPTEFTFYLPKVKAFCGAELLSRNMHNLYTLRGAKVRDALKWSNHINEAKELFSEAEVYFGSHHWPLWGNQAIQTFLSKQRDLYKYIHDQTVRMINNGLTSREIAEQIRLPKSLANYWPNRGYYGSLKHNAKAVYQFYMGWYDGNPANLDPLPPAQSAEKYVKAMGGAESVLKQGREAYSNGDYRWAAELLNHLVFAEPDHIKAKTLLAETYTQLGYQAESGPWRNVYLTATHELNNGAPEEGIDIKVMEQVLKNTGAEKFFTSMAVRVIPEKAEDQTTKLKIHFTDINERYLLWFENSVLHHKFLEDTDAAASESDISMKITHDLFVDILIDNKDIMDLVTTDDLNVEGSLIDLVQFLLVFEKPKGDFEVVVP